MFYRLLLLAMGGALGTLARYGLIVAVQSWTTTVFPMGTLVVNILGCFAMGALFGWFTRAEPPVEMRLFLATGILGGFTTFSAFGLDTVVLLKSQMPFAAIGYLLLSVIIGVAAVASGIWAIKIALH